MALDRFRVFDRYLPPGLVRDLLTLSLNIKPWQQFEHTSKVRSFLRDVGEIAAEVLETCQREEEAIEAERKRVLDEARAK